MLHAIYLRHLQQVSCRHNSDWLIWKARVVDIIIGCFLAMAVSWLVLPWYTSDEHLSFLGDAYTSAGKLAEKMYTTFYEACEPGSKVCSFSALQNTGRPSLKANADDYDLPLIS